MVLFVPFLGESVRLCLWFGGGLSYLWRFRVFVCLKREKSMSDHLVLYVDHLVRPVASESAQEANAETAGPSSSVADDEKIEENDDLNEQEPLLKMMECRICQEEDNLENLETPCACSGSLKVKPPFTIWFWSLEIRWIVFSFLLFFPMYRTWESEQLPNVSFNTFKCCYCYFISLVDMEYLHFSGRRCLLML